MRQSGAKLVGFLWGSLVLPKGCREAPDIAIRAALQPASTTGQLGDAASCAQLSRTLCVRALAPIFGAMRIG